jgi:hypothetical protein
LAITGQCKRRRIVINADAYISGATSNVPVLVKFNSTSHPDLFATGDDKDSVWFSSDASGQTTLYHEGVVFDSTDAIFYVKVDLSSTADTVIYLWYGQPAITGTEAKTSVWTNGQAIYHLETDGTDTLGNYTLSTKQGTVTHSTSYGVGGTSGAMTASSSRYNGDWYLARANNQEFTICGWQKNSVQNAGLIGAYDTSTMGFYPSSISSGTITQMAWKSYDYGGGGVKTATWSVSATASDWNFFTITNPTSTSYLYLQYNSGNRINFSGAYATSNYYSILCGPNGSSPNGGYHDEYWIFYDEKPENFHKAVYNNVVNYSTFITIDGSVAFGSSPIIICPTWPGAQEGYVRSVSASLGLTAAVSTQADYIRAVNCGLGINAEVEVPALEFPVVGLGIAAAITTQCDYIRAVSCGVGLATEVGEISEFTQAVSSNLGIAASITAQGDYSRSVSCGVGISAGPQKEIGKSITCGIGLSVTVTYQVYTDQDNFNIEKITVSKNIQDAMWQSTIQIDGTTVPPYYRHLRLYMKDHTDTDQLVFLGFLPSADYTLVAAGNKTTMTAYDYGWYLSSQYVPNSLRITDENTNPADTIKAILGGSAWEKETGIEPYKIDDVSGWGTTVTKKSFVFDKKTTKKQAIDEICSHCNFIFILKWRITSEGHSRPCAYFINEDDIDTDLDLPSKATFASGNAYLLGNVKVEDRQNEKINRVRVAGANPITGDWYEAVVESTGVTSGDEIPIEYYSESSSLDTQEKVDDKAQALFDFFNTVAKTYTATLLNRTDLRLYQKIQFTGYSKIDSEEMRIIGISYADLGTHREVTVQFTSDQSLSDLKALNRSMGGDIYNNTTNILNHYFIDLTKIAVGTITAIDGNTATVELEDGSGFVKARLINQDE